MKNLFKYIAILFTCFALIGTMACTKPGPDEGPDTENPADSTDNSGIIKLDYEIQSIYQTLHFDGVGEYQIILSNTNKLNESGMPTEEGGLMFLLYLYNAIDEDPLNATIPSGVYSSVEGKSEWGLSFGHSAAFLCVTDGELALSPIQGDVTVAFNNGKYTVDIDTDLPMITEGDSVLHINAQYQGDLTFIDRTSPLEPGFTNDVDLEYTDVYGRYYGNFYYPHSDDINLTFTIGEVSVDNYGIATLVDGYSLCLYSVYMPKLEDYNTKDITIAEGTYTIDSEDTWLMYSESSIPFLIERGKFEKNPFGEDYFPVGSYLQYIDKETGETLRALLSSGTMEVKRNGSSYDFTFDFKAENGVKITGSYSGEFTSLINANDNDMQPIMQDRPWTTLTADRQIEFLAGTECILYNSGNYLDPAYDQVIFTLAHPTEPCEIIMSQIVVEKGAAANGFPTGTYNVSWDIKPFTVFPGWYSMNQDLLYTWYGDSREESTNLAAIAGGSIEISKDSAGKYTLAFDFVDQKNNKITGTWTGNVIVDPQM